MDKIFDPKRYNMAFCPVCNGKGKVPKHPKGFDVCGKCGGFGFVKNEPKEDANTSQVVGREKKRNVIVTKSRV